MYSNQEWFSKNCATSAIVFLSMCLSVSNSRRKCALSLKGTRLLFSQLVTLEEGECWIFYEGFISNSTVDDNFACVMCLLVFIVCAWARPEDENWTWSQVKGWALGGCRLGSGFHFLSPEPPGWLLYSLSNAAQHWWFWQQLLCSGGFCSSLLILLKTDFELFWVISTCLYSSSDVHLPEIHRLSKASLGLWILSFSLPAQPDADGKRMRVLIFNGLQCERIWIFVTSCLSAGWIPIARWRQR